MPSYPISMVARKLFAVFIALAVLFAPVFSRAGEALASERDHHAQMIESGHCQSAPWDTDEHEDALEKTCCVSTCMAVAVTPPQPLDGGAPPRAADGSAISPIYVSYLDEIATPPPKFA